MIRTYSTNTKISEHFYSTEFKCKCGCGVTKIDDRLINMLESIYNKCNASAIIISSGYRCPYYDKKIGGFAGYHSKGMASDIQVLGRNMQPISTKVISCIAQDLFSEAGIANITPDFKFIHIDSRVGSRWLGNEVVSNGTVTKDFYQYYKLSRDEVQKACGEVIKGICQMPDNGKFLLGLEVFNNDGYEYEIQIYSDTHKAWIDGSGRVNNGANSFWYYFNPPTKGVYMSLFRVYKNNNVLSEKTYLFERG